MGLIFAEFATSPKSPKIEAAKNKPYYTSSWRVLEIAKIWLSENLTVTHPPSVIFTKISRCEKFPIYRMLSLIGINSINLSCSQGYFNVCPLWPWPLSWPPQLIGFIHLSWEKCCKFKEVASNSLFYIVFTRWRCDTHKHGLCDALAELQRHYYKRSPTHCVRIMWHNYYFELDLALNFIDEMNLHLYYNVLT